MSKSNGHKALSDFRPQRANANKHKPFGLKLITDSIQRDGYSAPMVAAADGEIFAGSARLEAVGDVLNAEPIIVHSDGTRPVIHVRDDIPNADDPKARRLGVADNVIARIDYDPDGALLAALAADDDILKQMIAADEMSLRAVMGVNAELPTPGEQQEPLLLSECFIEIRCSKQDLESMSEVLNEWASRPTVTVNIS